MLVSKFNIPVRTLHNYHDFTDMEVDALAVANYFIDLSRRDRVDLHLLGLVKRVYIAHGFSLALTGQSLLNPRFDRAEAWKYGPVIPSVYHTFKHNRRNPIREHAVVSQWNFDKKEEVFNTPELTDPIAKTIVEAVWKRYLNVSDGELIDLTHREGTPWSMSYEPQQNNEIPDLYTEAFYKKLLENIRKEQAQKGN